MLKRILCYCIGTFLPVLGFSQNLIKNGGFEEFKYCPVGFNNSTMELVKGWDQPTTGTADYYHTCSKNAGVPENIFGSQPAHGGEGYIGLISYAPDKRNYREYMQTKLKQPLDANQLYCVEFYVSLADFSNYRTDALGVFVSEQPLKGPHQYVIDSTAQVKVPPRYVLRNNEEWVKISGIFKAKGGESFLTLGNFRPDRKVKVSRRNLPREGRVWDYAYYYVDDISLKPVKDSTGCDCTTEEFEEAMKNPNFIWDQELTRIELGSVLFDFDKYNLDREDREQLDKVAKMMLENEGFYLEILGHTDSIGPHGHNNTLSQNRANAVYKYMLSKGIKPNHMRIQYYGEHLPIVPNSNSEARARNRRVEFILWEE